MCHTEYEENYILHTMLSENKILTCLLLLLLGYSPLLMPHGVGLEIERREAQVIWLHHDDGTPLSDARYELSVVGVDRPYQTGYTDARGRVVFIPGDDRQWRLRVFSQDGHGIDTGFELDRSTLRRSQIDLPVSGITKVILGIGILLSGFGILMLFAKRDKR